MRSSIVCCWWFIANTVVRLGLGQVVALQSGTRGPGRVLLQGIGKRNNVSSVSGSEMTTCSATGDRDQEKGGCGGTSGCYVAFVTCPSMDVAKKISRGLVQKRLAACVNVVPQVTSIYEWEGKVEEDSESLLMIKTSQTRIEELTAFVKSNHPYDTPEVIALKVEGGSSDYLQWVKQMTQKT